MLVVAAPFGWGQLPERDSDVSLPANSWENDSLGPIGIGAGHHSIHYMQLSELEYKIE